MNFKTSIITINYNDRPGLKKTIDSVRGQTFRNFEFIIIDGNSSDGSKKLIEENADIITQAISEPDNGIYHAMNKGIRIATGDYLLFLNSGDFLYDTSVMQKINTMIDGNYGIYYGDIIYDEPDHSRTVTFPDQLTFDFFYEQNLSHQASFIKRSLFQELFFYNEEYKIVSDWEFFLYAICKRDVSYKHLDTLVTVYDATGISSNLDNHQMMNIERTQSLHKHFPSFMADYTGFSEYKFNKAKQFLHIKKHPVAWKILKAFMNLILLFLPKFNKR
jgi:glycosyltransferase involved in cell wall biosynthesis